MAERGASKKKEKKWKDTKQEKEVRKNTKLRTHIASYHSLPTSPHNSCTAHIAETGRCCAQNAQTLAHPLSPMGTGSRDYNFGNIHGDCLLYMKPSEVMLYWKKSHMHVITHGNGYMHAKPSIQGKTEKLRMTHPTQ